MVHKPSGLLVFPGPEAPDRDTCLSRLWRQFGKPVQPCHRLDRGTSGALLLSFTPEVTRSLFMAFQERRVHKRYWAVVRGYFGKDVTLDYPLDGKDALSHIRCLEQFCIPFCVGKYPTSRYSLVEVRPYTGRRHQVRHHLRHVSSPIVGDIRYGDTIHNRWLKQLFGWKRLALAAVELGFTHPVTGEEIAVKCPLAWEYQALLEQLRLARDQDLPETLGMRA